jgi:hypothetical protein
MPSKGGNLWSKLAGEYYQDHQNDPDIESFSDVLKSPKFREYYNSMKNKTTISEKENGKKTKKTKKNVGRKFKKSNKKREPLVEMVEAEPVEAEPVEVEVKKGKSLKSNKKSNMPKLPEMKQPLREDREHLMKNDYFNGGKKNKNITASSL